MFQPYIQQSLQISQNQNNTLSITATTWSSAPTHNKQRLDIVTNTHSSHTLLILSHPVTLSPGHVAM